MLIYFVFFLQQLRTKIQTLPEKRVSNERNLCNEQKRYDRILELAPAKETVSIYWSLSNWEQGNSAVLLHILSGFRSLV